VGLFCTPHLSPKVVVVFCTPHLSPKVVVVAEERVQKSEEKLSEVSHSVEASQKQLSEPWLLDQENLNFLANYPGNQATFIFHHFPIKHTTIYCTTYVYRG